MVKKRSGSSGRVRRASKSGRSIVRYTQTAADRARMARRAPPQPPDAERDPWGIWEVSPEQLAAFRRTGRPPIGAEARQPIAIRIDRRVLATLRREASRRGMGYQTLINDLLASAAIKLAHRKAHQ